MDGIAKICDRLLSYGMDQVKLYVGERLSYPEERITEGTAESLKDREFDALSVVLLVNEEPEKLTTHGLSDEMFLRAKVPMTKQGIRSISLSKLSLQEDSLCWDVEPERVPFPSKWQDSVSKEPSGRLKKRKKQWNFWRKTGESLHWTI